MQWAARANEAFRTLRSPVARAAYLCERHGQPIEAESNTAMPAAFLMQQMQWREELDEARGGDGEAAHALAREVEARRQEVLARVASALDERHDYADAAAGVRELHFIDRFREELAAYLAGEDGRGQEH
jgi:molecular chaperone HscB